MPKNIEDIIVPERRRSIRDIPIPEGRRKDSGYEALSTLKEYGSPLTPRIPRKGVWIASGIALLILIFAVLSIFNGATLAYVPKSAPLSFNNDIYVTRKTGEGELLYSVVKLSKDKGLDAPVSGEEEVSRKASGVIVVYNDASTQAQRLVENTRFETTRGLVYRIPKAIVIPGKKTVAGVIEPGSVETIVYADEAGEKYNIGLTDFTLPGLKGGARFSTIYARSKTDMSGGFVGIEKVVNEQDRAKVKVELETTLKDELISEARAQVPEDFILFQSLSSVAFEDLPQTSSVNRGSAAINMRGNLYGIMFKRSDLYNHLAGDKTSIVSGESVDIVDIDSLNLAFMGIVPENLPVSNEIKFSVTGEATALWRTDEVALKADLVGKHKRNIPSILNNYPTIVSATATIRPFWKSSFPSDSAQISVKKLPVK